MMQTTILWLRRDLRLQHNPALQWACKNSEAIIPVYVHAPDEEAPWQPGGASRWWLDQSLRSLEQSLTARGLELQCFSGNSLSVLKDIIQTTKAGSVVFNRLYEPHLYQRDEKVRLALQAKAVDVHAFDSGLFCKPGSVLNNQHLPYRVYTPFSKKIRQHLQLYPSLPVTEKQNVTPVKSIHLNNACSIDALQLNDQFNWYGKLHQYWQPGEAQAHKRLDAFLDNSVSDYDQQRDIPSIDGTSALSAHLHFGEISVEQIYPVLMPYLEGVFGAMAQSSAEQYLNQLIWREFAHHILWHYPHTPTQPMDKRFNHRFWKKPGKSFR
ncbi:MAG: deoxyribodipyrimidine photo-lyase, partial [Gammaproteobacteria bacterium]